MKRRGRTSRRRIRSSKVQINTCHQEIKYLQLVKWARKLDFEKCYCKFLCPAEFKDTGRGLMTKKNLREDDLIISIPQKMLITTKTALKLPLILDIVTRFGALTPVQALCIFLIIERLKGSSSFWYPYIQTLPQYYSTPAHFTDVELEYLPLDIRWKADDLIKSLNHSYEQLESVIRYIRMIDGGYENSFMFEDYRWAWHVVNTRCVYMKQEESDLLTEDEDHYALAPFLDLLNHSASVKVNAAFNSETSCYEIRSLVKFTKYNQVFISYGPHDNSRLLVEYGFVLPDNPHNVVKFTSEDIRSAFQTDDKLKDLKLEIIQKHKLQEYHCSYDGCSWELVKTAEILCMDYNNLIKWKPHIEDIQFKQPRKNILIGLLEKKITLFQVTYSELLNKDRTQHEDMILVLYEQFCDILNFNISQMSSQS